MHLFVQTALAGAVFRSKLGQGMRVSPKDFLLLRREPSLICKSLLLAWLVPLLVTAAVLTCLRPPHATVVGLTLAAMCPAPALLFSGAISAGGRPAYAATLQRLLSISALLVIPLLLKCLPQLLGFRVTIGPLVVSRQLALAVLVPTAAGMLTQRLAPKLSSKFQPKLSSIGTYAYLLVGTLVLCKAYPTLFHFGWRSSASVIIITATSLALGQLLCPGQSGDGRALALACASRNTGLALLIASINFPSQAAAHHLVPYLVLSTACTTAYQHWPWPKPFETLRPKSRGVEAFESGTRAAKNDMVKRPAFLR